MADTADQIAPAARDDQSQVPGGAPGELLAGPLRMLVLDPASANFRFLTDAELMDGPDSPIDPDDEEDGEGEPDDDSDGADDSIRVEVVVPDFPEGSHAGFVCTMGCPNTDKSALTNAMVGIKIAITSGRPQATCHNVRGIIHKGNTQIVLVDTPGLRRPRTLLDKRLSDLVRETLADVDVVVFCIPVNGKIGPGDHFITRDLAKLHTPVVAAVTKADIVTREALAAQLLAVSELGEQADIVPVSAQRSKQVDVLGEVLLKYVSLSPPLYPIGKITGGPQQVMIAEFMHKTALEGVRSELPYSPTIVVDEIADPDGEHEVGRVKGVRGRLRVCVGLVVERGSQKAIIIDESGRRLKEAGVTARKGIKQLLGRKVYLDLYVCTARDWQSGPKTLARSGF